MNSSVVACNMFCGFCKNNGKDFKSHDLKNKKGMVTCKELLNTECNFCHKFGHTKKHCDVLQEKIKNKKEKDDENYNNSFPLMVSCMVLPKDKKQQIKIKTSYKDISIIDRNKIILDEIDENYKIINIEIEKKKNIKDEENKRKRLIQDKEKEFKNELYKQRKQYKIQQKKEQKDLFVSDMKELLGCNWFIYIKKHFVMEDLIKKYNLLSVVELHDIRREYKYNFYEQMERESWEDEIQQEIYDKEYEIQQKKDDEFKKYQEVNLSLKEFIDWENEQMDILEAEFENDCGFCGTNASLYMQCVPDNYVSHYIKTGQQLDPDDKELERNKMKKIN